MGQVVVLANSSSFAPGLEILDLSCNEIAAATLDGSFARLTSLRQLDLSRNRIHFLSAADFQPLRLVPLDVLNLAETELADIEDDALCPLSGTLKYLSLTGNPLEPDNLARLLALYSTTPQSPDDIGGDCTGCDDNNTLASHGSSAEPVEPGLSVHRDRIHRHSVHSPKTA